MVYFQAKTPTLGKFLKVLQWKILEYFMDIWIILRPFAIFCGFYGDLVYISPILVCFTEEHLATLVGSHLMVS
jgi:hypothetical protein